MLFAETHRKLAIGYFIAQGVFFAYIIVAHLVKLYVRSFIRLHPDKAAYPFHADLIYAVRRYGIRIGAGVCVVKARIVIAKAVLHAVFHGIANYAGYEAVPAGYALHYAYAGNAADYRDQQHRTAEYSRNYCYYFANVALFLRLLNGLNRLLSRVLRALLSAAKAFYKLAHVAYPAYRRGIRLIRRIAISYAVMVALYRVHYHFFAHVIRLCRGRRGSEQPLNMLPYPVLVYVFHSFNTLPYSSIRLSWRVRPSIPQAAPRSSSCPVPLWRNTACARPWPRSPSKTLCCRIPPAA